MAVEAPVLGGDHRLRQVARHVLEPQRLAEEIAEGGHERAVGGEQRHRGPPLGHGRDRRSAAGSARNRRATPPPRITAHSDGQQAPLPPTGRAAAASPCRGDGVLRPAVGVGAQIVWMRGIAYRGSRAATRALVPQTPSRPRRAERASCRENGPSDHPRAAEACAVAACSGGERARPDASPVIAVVIFVATYAVIALGRLPGARLDRAGAALIGASLMVASGTLSLDEAYRAIDLDTLTLLLGMMIVVANLRFAGFFGLAARGDRAPRAPSGGAAAGHHRGVGRAVGLSRQRHGVPDADAAGRRDGARRCGAIRCPICWRWRWRPTSAAPPPSPAIRRTS